jgi:hypothetical protein
VVRALLLSALLAWLGEMYLWTLDLAIHCHYYIVKITGILMPDVKVVPVLFRFLFRSFVFSSFKDYLEAS